MQNILAIFVGVLLFLVMVVIRSLIKLDEMGERPIKKNRFYNIIGVLVSLLVSALIYYMMCRMVRIHCKLCCINKAWVISLTLYAVYKQFFGIGRQTR